MAIRNKRRAKAAGLPPGILIHVGEKKTAETVINVINYDEPGVRQKEAVDIEECFTYKNKSSITWINIEGIHEIDVIKKLGDYFSLHPLTLEDILHTQQRPKLEDFEDYLFIVLKMPHFDEQNNKIKIEQISLILGPNFVISFNEGKENVFTPVRNRIYSGKGRIRKMRADYLAYALIDVIVDNYFIVLENIGVKIGDIEEELMDDPRNDTLHKIHELKREMMFFRKSVWPLRELVRILTRDDISLINEPTKVFIDDVYDHAIQVIDTIETYRDMLSGMLDLYLSTISNKTNEVMRTLTIVATIFIPLTFIAGLYGMNFENMPETKWRWGYPIIIFVISSIGVSMLFYFKRKKWF